MQDSWIPESIRALNRGDLPYSLCLSPCPFPRVKGVWLVIDNGIVDDMYRKPEFNTITRELQCKGTPATLATAMVKLSEKTYREHGTHLFWFPDKHNIPQPPVNQTFDPDAILIEDIWVVPSSDRFEISDLNIPAGRIELQAIAPNRDGPRTMLKFKCRQEGLPLSEKGWVALLEELRRLGFTPSSPREKQGPREGVKIRAYRAHMYIRAGTRKTHACQQADIDLKTYNKYLNRKWITDQECAKYAKAGLLGDEFMSRK